MSSIIVVSILSYLPSSPHEKEAFKSMFLSQHAKLTIAKLKIQAHLSFITLFSYILFYSHSVNFLLIFVKIFYTFISQSTNNIYRLNHKIF